MYNKNIDDLMDYIMQPQSQGEGKKNKKKAKKRKEVEEAQTAAEGDKKGQQPVAPSDAGPASSSQRTAVSQPQASEPAASGNS